MRRRRVCMGIQRQGRARRAGCPDHARSGRAPVVPRHDERRLAASSAVRARRSAAYRMEPAAMKERPILFSGAMVRALLDGRKTQTRRVVKWPKDMEIDHAAVERLATSNDTYLLDRCPYGVPSDRLWVRETTYDVERNGYVGPVF